MIHAIVGVAGLFALLAMTVMLPSTFAEEVLRALDGDTLDRATRAETAVPAQREGPPIVWLRFDRESAPQTGITATSPLTPPAAIAKALHRLRTEPQARPWAAYLDVDILRDGEGRSGPALAKELADWRRDANAPVLAVFAGSACMENSGGDVTPFVPAAYPAVGVPGPDGSFAAGLNLYWSCPIFDGPRQHEWSCVTQYVPPEPSLVALPSPAWIAAEVRARQGKPGPRLAELNRGATAQCRGQGDAARGRQSLVGVDPGGEIAMMHNTANGQAVLNTISMGVALSPQGDLGAVHGAIAVIGGNYRFRDTFLIGNARVEGGVLIGAAMRTVAVSGLLSPPSRWRNMFIAIAVLVLCYGALTLLHHAREKVVARPPGLAKALLLPVTHEQVVLAVLVALLFFLPGLLALRLATPLVLAIVLLELMLFLDQQIRDWNHA